jgi:predicted MFS family arabinose efflux permease
MFGALETLVGFAPTYLTAVVLLIPTGFFMIYFAQAANQRVQLSTAPEFRGRVMALYVLVFLGTTPFGAMLVGWLAEQFGPRSGMWIGGLASVLAALLVGVVQLRRADAEIDLHIRPRPHVHVHGPATGGRVIDLRVPAIRPAAR